MEDNTVNCNGTCEVCICKSTNEVNQIIVMPRAVETTTK
jgi:hypothetical protein